MKLKLQYFVGRGTSGNRNGGVIEHRRASDMDMKMFSRLPKQLQTDNIIDLNKDKTIDGTRYRALVEFDDGFQRSIAEYSWSEFKDYLGEVMLKNRHAER